MLAWLSLPINPDWHPQLFQLILVWQTEHEWLLVHFVLRQLEVTWTEPACGKLAAGFLAKHRKQKGSNCRRWAQDGLIRPDGGNFLARKWLFFHHCDLCLGITELVLVYEVLVHRDLGSWRFCKDLFVLTSQKQRLPSLHPPNHLAITHNPGDFISCHWATYFEAVDPAVSSFFLCMSEAIGLGLCSELSPVLYNTSCKREFLKEPGQ